MVINSKFKILGTTSVSEVLNLKISHHKYLQTNEWRIPNSIGEHHTEVPLRINSPMANFYCSKNLKKSIQSVIIILSCSSFQWSTPSTQKLSDKDSILWSLKEKKAKKLNLKVWKLEGPISKILSGTICGEQVVLQII